LSDHPVLPTTRVVRRSSLVFALVLALPLTASAAASPAQLMASALAAGRSQRSVHYASVAGGSSGISVRMVGDAAVDRGIQRITYTRNRVTGHVTVIVVSNTAYVRGDAFTLMHDMGFSAAAAAQQAGKWIVIQHSSKAFAPVAADVRLASTIDSLKLPAPLTAVAKTVIHGQHVVGIRSSHPVSGHPTTQTLYVRAASPMLPVAEIGRQGATRVRVVYSNWNEPVHLSAPPVTIAARS
jgi:hypothetical protein